MRLASLRFAFPFGVALRLALPVGAALLAAPLVRAQDGTTPIRATDLYELRSVSDVAVSPDGRLVAYTVRQAWRENESPTARTGYRAQLWLVPADGSRPARPLTPADGSVSQVAWHPASDRLAFVRTTGEGAAARPQVFVLPLEGGEAMPVTRPDDRASSPSFSPDGTRLLVSVSQRESDLRKEGRRAPAWLGERPGPDGSPRMRPADSVVANPDGSLAQIRAWLDRNAEASNPRVYTRLNYLDEAGLAGEMSFRHLAVVELPGVGEAPRAARKLVRGYQSVGAAAWLDDRTVLVSASDDTLRHPDVVNTGALYRLDVRSGARREFLRAPGRRLGGPVVAGGTVAFAYSDPDDGFYQTRVAAADTSGRNLRILTESVDRSAGGVVLSKDGRTAFFTAGTDGGVPLYRVATDGRTPAERLTPLTRGVSSFDVAPDGRAAFAALTEVVRPSDLARLSLVASPAPRLARRGAPAASAAAPAGSPAYLTDVNPWLKTRRVVRYRTGWVERPGERPVQFWTIAPADSADGRRHPLVVQMHGGPAAMWGPGEASMWHEFQFYAARGYAVVFANPRGSGGYGRAFQRANYQDWGAGPMADVLAAADRALALPYVDPERQVLTGGSYAGYLTAWIVAHTNRFKAAAAQRGVYDIGTFFGEGNAWRLVENSFGGFPWQDSVVVRSAQRDSLAIRELVREQSPLTHVENIRTPLLIKHGDADRRTGYVQSEMLFRSLAQLGRPVEYARYPGATHELSRSGDPKQRLDRLLRLYEFLARYAEPAR